MLHLTVKQLQDIISQAVSQGLQMYEKSLDPLSDRLTKAEARKYIVRMGYSVALMKRWEDKGLLRGTKSGDSYNSPVYYSLSDIKGLISAVKAKEILLEN